MYTDPVSIANSYYWGYLPMGTTNFGGDRQIFTIDTQSIAPIGCSLNFPGVLAINGWFDAPLVNNWGLNSPIGVNPNLGYGYYC
jgi:hypothetical protein